jgi:hypothetical protein
MGYLRSHCANIDYPFYHPSGHIFDSPVKKLGQNACVGNCFDDFDVSGERSKAILAPLFLVLLDSINVINLALI